MSKYRSILGVFQLLFLLAQLVIHEFFLKLAKYGTDTFFPPNMLCFKNKIVTQGLSDFLNLLFLLL